MAKIVNSTRSERIAAKLRYDIIGGELAGGTPLKSIRLLAEEFGVGRQVIHSALQILEREKLLESRDRQGFIVRDPRTSAGTGILFLAYNVEEDNPYLCHLQVLTSPPHLPDHFNSWSRIVPRRLASQENWEMELKRIAGISGIDFLLIHSTYLTPEQVKMTATLPFPVIFLSDFSNPESSKLPITQIVDVAEDETGIALDYLRENAGNSVAMISFSSEHAYTARYIRQAKIEAAARNMEFQVFCLPLAIVLSSKEEEIKILRALLEQIPDSVNAIYLAGVSLDCVLKACPGIEKRFQIFCTTGNRAGFAAHLEPDFRPFFQTVFDLCRASLAGEDIRGRHRVHLQYRIVPGKDQKIQEFSL